MQKRTVSDEVIAEAFAKRCHKCRFRGAESKTQCCDYILVTSHMRGCSITDCDKFEPGRRLRVGEPPNSPVQRKRREITKPSRNVDQRRKLPAKTELGRLIDAYCKAHGLYIMEFAHELGVSRSTVSSWRMGKYTPEEETLKRLCGVIGVDVEAVRAMIESEGINEKTE